MGQCSSTLPTDAHARHQQDTNSTTSTHNYNNPTSKGVRIASAASPSHHHHYNSNHQERDDYSTTRRSAVAASAANGTSGSGGSSSKSGHDPNDPSIPLMNNQQGNTSGFLKVKVPNNEYQQHRGQAHAVQADPHYYPPPSQVAQQRQQQRQAQQGNNTNNNNNEPVPMEEDAVHDDQREEIIPSPPESAIKTRCYKLNLDSDCVGITCDTSTKRSKQAMSLEGVEMLGPYYLNNTNTMVTEPCLTQSASDDSCISTGNNKKDTATAVAVKTAQIFRGITISQDGTILSQNARASRSSRHKGNQNKRGEKSRQAAKIDKAKDLVEESILTGKAPDSDKPANMVSLYIFGEYDDMNHLVRDGSKKLLDAKGMPDDALLAINKMRPVTPTVYSRGSSHYKSGRVSSTSSSVMSPTRKRLSPHSHGKGHDVLSYNDGFGTPSSKSTRHNLPQTAPPKLKGHPRDRPSTRGSRRFTPVHDACNSMFSAGTPQHGGNNGGGGGFNGSGPDWSDSLGFSRGLNSLWICGGNTSNGTTSPTQDPHHHYHPTSPTHHMNTKDFGFNNKDGSGHYSQYHQYHQEYYNYHQAGDETHAYRERRNDTDGRSSRRGESAFATGMHSPQERIDAPGRDEVVGETIKV